MEHLELIKARHSLGLTQTELARALFRTRDCVAKWESGNFPIPKHVDGMLNELAKGNLEAN